jgi:hypothetical protein
MAVKFNLYSSEGCHLCEQAFNLITQIINQEEVDVIDIVDNNTGDQNLVELYGVHIPVLERLADNAKLFWPFDVEKFLEFNK